MAAVAVVVVAFLFAHDLLMAAGPVPVAHAESAASVADHPHAVPTEDADHGDPGHPADCSPVRAATAANALGRDDLAADRSAGVVLPLHMPEAVLAALVSSPWSSSRPAGRAMLQVWRI